ncbi:MAG TPA: metallophosphoesterase [Phycisphaerae bacterium]|nr:metallophosphoesterase [Phycisphaerae bacterium]HPS52193.1 metallophosphoesterase [Phycisphaerae bacterium]
MTRILVTSDLHYDVKRSQDAAERLATHACKTGGDAIVLAGDTAGADLEKFSQALALFKNFSGQKLLVPGNHCLWCNPIGIDGLPPDASIERYEKLIPQVAEEHGFAVLDQQPLVMDGTGLVGSVGWYDYSMRCESLGIPLDFYRIKLSPGAARYMGGYETLLEKYGNILTQEHMSLGVRWMDGFRVRLGMSDEAFLNSLLAKLKRQLEEISRHADRIIAFIHHLPFMELVPQKRPMRFAFAAAYLGSIRIGQLLRNFENVTDIFCGHSHWPAKYNDGKIIATAMGNTYLEKRLTIVEC